MRAAVSAVVVLPVIVGLEPFTEVRCRPRSWSRLRCCSRR